MNHPNLRPTGRDADGKNTGWRCVECGAEAVSANHLLQEPCDAPPANQKTRLIQAIDGTGPFS